MEVSSEPAYCPLHTARCPLPTGYCPLPTIYCTLLTAHCILHTTHCILPSAHFLLHTTHCPSHTAHCPPHTAHCTLSTVHCTLYTVHRTLSTTHCPLPTAQSCQNCSPQLLEHKYIHSFALLLFTQTSFCCGFNNIRSPIAWLQCHSKATVKGAGSLPTNQSFGTAGHCSQSSHITAFPLVVSGPTHVSFSSYTDIKVHGCTAPLSPTDTHT